MMVWMGMELIGSVDVILSDIGLKVGQLVADFCHTLTQIRPSITHMGKMTTPKPLINIIWTCQKMMVWMSMELIGSVDVILSDFGLKEVGQLVADSVIP
jgi:hypothetical protein